MYKYRKGKLVAKGVHPTLKRLIFFRTALSRAVSLQPLIRQAGGDNFEPKPPPPSSSSSSASGGAAASEAVKAAILHQTSQIDAVLRMNADLQTKLHEQERKVQEQERAIALLQLRASSPRPLSQRDEA